MASYDYSRPLESTFTSSSQSPAFQVSGGKPFNITLSGTFVATMALQRSFDGGGDVVPGDLSRRYGDHLQRPAFHLLGRERGPDRLSPRLHLHLGDGLVPDQPMTRVLSLIGAGVAVGHV